MTYHAWPGEKKAGAYADIPGFCRSATSGEIRKHGHVLTPGRYAGTEAQENEGAPFTLVDRFRANFRAG
jgi:type I restriction enzyme M protein